jgi:hypothetical protein
VQYTQDIFALFQLNVSAIIFLAFLFTLVVYLSCSSKRKKREMKSKWSILFLNGFYKRLNKNVLKSGLECRSVVMWLPSMLGFHSQHHLDIYIYVCIYICVCVIYICISIYLYLLSVFISVSISIYINAKVIQNFVIYTFYAYYYHTLRIDSIVFISIQM